MNNRSELENQRGRQSYQLVRAVDEKKDQSYFLYRLRREQLGHILFPVGGMTKSQVREEARRRGLPVADKPDSQGICFMGDVDVREMLRKKLGVRKGEVVVRKTRNPNIEARNKFKIQNPNAQKVSNFDIRDSSLRDDYEVVGEHDGVWFYTIGQRHGFRFRAKSLGQRAEGGDIIPPFYVIDKDVEKNRLVVGFGVETYSDQFTVSQMNWLGQSAKGKAQRVYVRIRHGGELIKSKVKSQKSKVLVNLGEAQRGIAAGQSAVFYTRDGVVLGGGIIG